MKIKIFLAVTQLALSGCLPRERQLPPVGPSPSVGQLSSAAERQIANCENDVQSTMKEFHLKNTDDTEATRKAESDLFGREQSVCDRIRESYGVALQNQQTDWGGNQPIDNNEAYQNHMARDMLTGAALGAGATYMLNRNKNRRQANDPNYSNYHDDNSHYRNSQEYRRPAPTAAPLRRYARPTRGVFRSRRR